MNHCLYYSPLYYLMWVDSREVPPLVIPGHLPPSRMPWERIEAWLREVYRGDYPESDLEAIRKMDAISSYGRRSRINACLVRDHYIGCQVYDALHSQGLHRKWLVEEEGPNYSRAIVASIQDLLDPVLEVTRDSDTGRLLVQDFHGGRYLGPDYGVLDVDEEQPWLEKTIHEQLRGLS